MGSANILLRGQSNAILFGSEDISSQGGLPSGVSTGLAYTQYIVSALTGLTINLIYSGNGGGITSNPNTVSLADPY